MISLKKEPSYRHEIDKVTCNMCGEELKRDTFGYLSDYVHVEKKWGYNSNKDGRGDSFDLCEDCYDKILNSFKVHPEANF